jgi:AcrR family transcriptional regulator
VAAAVRVADAEGLDAVSMGRVAAELGAAPMSLYRHVSSKEELLTLMVDAAWGGSPDPRAPGEGWRAGLSRWAWTMRTQIRQHPWTVRIPLHSLPIMPREVAWFENALACMGGTGLSPAEWMSSYSRMLAKLTEPQDFPALSTFIAAGVFEIADGPDDEFIFGLDRILDGIEHLIEAKTTTRGTEFR